MVSKRFLIWDEHIDPEKWTDFLQEDKEMNPFSYEGLSGRELEAEEWQRIQEMNEQYLEDERCNLDKVIGRAVIELCKFQYWNGIEENAFLISSGNMKDIFRRHCRASMCRWYSDGNNICCDESHHDGTNHYIYKVIPESYTGECSTDVSLKTLLRHARSMAPYVANVYVICSKRKATY